uniref:Carbohydrate sulfotransferase n=1 Tax=Erpetoichthys calabaricus TaxID=27687 RepID=A0A8C4RXS2_ERPCA
MSLKHFFLSTLTLGVVSLLCCIYIQFKHNGTPNDILNRWKLHSSFQAETTFWFNKDLHSLISTSHHIPSPKISDISQNASLPEISEKTKQPAEQQHFTTMLTYKPPNTTYSSELKWKEFKERQQKRKSFLLNTCTLYNNSKTQRISLSQMVSRIYVEDKYKILYCEVPKVGCSNWKRILMVLNGKAQSATQIVHKDVHYGKHLQRLSSFNISGIQQRLNSFTKIIVVRDPMERLVSAFRDKFEHPNSYYHPQYGKIIIKKYRKNATQEALNSGSGVTFKEFVQYILGLSPAAIIDTHWNTINKLCFPCFINYDFIGKFETLEDDANYILRSIGAPTFLKFPSFKDRHPTDEKTSFSIVKEYMLQLSEKEKNLLFSFYSMDYLMFNYTLHNF